MRDGNGTHTVVLGGHASLSFGKPFEGLFFVADFADDHVDLQWEIKFMSIVI